MATSKPLPKLLASPEFRDRWEAVRELEKIATLDHVDLLKRLLKDPESGLRKNAALLLAQVRAVDAAVDIEPLLDDSWHGVRVGAVRALMRLRPEVYIDRVARMVDDRNAHVQAEVMSCLLATGDPERAAQLLPLLRVSEDRLNIRAAQAMCSLAPEKHLPAILPLLDNPEPEVQTAVMALVRKYGMEEHLDALIPLTKAADRGVRIEATLTLAPRYPDIHAPELICWLEESPLQSDDWSSLEIGLYSVIRAIRLLGSLGRNEAVPSLARMFGHADQDLAGQAALALARLHSSSHGDSIRALTRADLIDVRLSGTLALLRLGRLSVAEELKAMDDVESWMREPKGCLHSGAEIDARAELVEALFDRHAPSVFKALSTPWRLTRDIRTTVDLRQELEDARIPWTGEGGCITLGIPGKANTKTTFFQLAEDLRLGHSFVPRAAGVFLIPTKGELDWWRSKLHSGRDSLEVGRAKRPK